MKINIFALSMLFFTIPSFAMELDAAEKDEVDQEKTELAKLEREAESQKSVVDLLGDDLQDIFPDHSEDDVRKGFKHLKKRDPEKHDGLVDRLGATRTRGTDPKIDPELNTALLQALSVGLSARGDAKKEERDTERKNRGTERKKHIAAEGALGIISTGLGLAWFLWSKGCS